MKNISIVIASYNNQKYLPQAIESVLNQTYKDFELLIWDDGSTDNSLSIAKGYLKQDSRIKVLSSENEGYTKTLKKALSLLNGDYLCWLDSDDILHPKALELTSSFLDNNKEIGLVYTDYTVIDEDSKPLGQGSRCRIPYSKKRLLLDFMVFHFRLMRREVYEAVGGIDTKYPFAQDYDLCLRISESFNIHHLAEPLYFYRQHDSSISNTHSLEQILCTKDIIQAAMHRRGLSFSFDLKLRLLPQYSIVHKKTGLPISRP